MTPEYPTRRWPGSRVAYNGPVLSRQEAEERLRRFFADRAEPIAAIYLFGSLALGTAGPSSDADVAVLLTEDPPRTLDGLLLDLEGDLEAELGIPTQIVILNRAPADLVHHVLLDGILVAERDRAVRVDFEVRARNEYFDLKPILDRYRGVSAPHALRRREPGR
jgi:predicted nucleotidyltransferase